jgi:hypothetical protein
VVAFAERRVGEVADSFLRWLDGAPPRFFAWLHFYDAHARYDPPEGFKLTFPFDLYSGEIERRCRARAGAGGAVRALRSRRHPGCC